MGDMELIVDGVKRSVKTDKWSKLALMFFQDQKKNGFGGKGLRSIACCVYMIGQDVVQDA